jgi:hypothetical protein
LKVLTLKSYPVNRGEILLYLNTANLLKTLMMRKAKS